MSFEKTEQALAAHYDRLDVLFRTIAADDVRRLCQEIVCTANTTFVSFTKRSWSACYGIGSMAHSSPRKPCRAFNSLPAQSCGSDVPGRRERSPAVNSCHGTGVSDLTKPGGLGAAARAFRLTQDIGPLDTLFQGT
jgi:hypothetical protein